MGTGEARNGPLTGEARLTIDGGLAYFPALAKERVVSFDDLAPLQRREIAALAEAADFFNCMPEMIAARPDARTYIVGLTIDGRSRDVHIAEPVGDSPLARLVTIVRRLAAQP